MMVNDKDLLTVDYKKDFPLLAAKDVAYLDNSATTQKPQCVIDAECNFYLKHNANPLRGLYELAMEATDAYEINRHMRMHALLYRGSSTLKASRRLFSRVMRRRA